ncbi:hypothetical protein BCR35DRAFT_354853 [Leucosporidium creatinivorum]|uniref:DNA-directed RNA polymerase III subunit RPC3 n=1 Tax=Leucosporidium creatinivorum TaxID=106004 RepID=A0A1Y2E5K1_9BASI|nr:hypothetical protein BCR35DRAFT_354853 [Leucosporidium creatinivorum]
MADRIRLLQHVVHRSFGSAVGEVASILLTRGSLAFPQLTRLSALPPSTIYSCLLILSLHSLLYHSESEVNGRLVELYEMNEVGIERRMRGGWYVEMAREWNEAACLDAVIESLWTEGMQKGDSMAEVAARAMLKRQAENDREREGYENRGEEIPERLRFKGKKIRLHGFEDARKAAKKMLRKAFSEGYISIVTPGSQLSPSSLEIKWEEELRLGIKGIPSAKDMKQLKSDLRAKKEEWAEEEVERAKGGSLDSGKRKKFVEGMDDYPELPPKAFFRINADRFHIRWRGEVMQQFAHDYYNESVAKVFGVILKIADKSCDTMEDNSSKTISRQEIQSAWENLPSGSRPKLKDCFGDGGPDPNWHLIEKKDGDLITEIAFVLAGADHQGMSGSGTFLVQQGEGPGARWSVHYDVLGGWMKRTLVEAIIKDKLGEVAIRCWRILEAKGKLDEKHLARLAFLSVKDAREVIGRLSAADLIEPQEVPRSADRAPSRTFFLWYVDFHKVLLSLLGHQYKALANLQAQKDFQLSQRKALVEKRERTDVRADPSLLGKRDVAAIAELDKVMEALTVAEMRIGAQCFVLSELDP